MAGQANRDVTIERVNDSDNQDLLRDFIGERSYWIRANGYCLPSQYERDVESFTDFEVRSTDTWVVTFPRSGTTLTQEMVWLIANEFNFQSASKIPLVERFPFFEYHLFMHPKTKEMFKQENSTDPSKQDLIDKLSTPAYIPLSSLTGPRFIKTHFPFSLLPKGVLNSKVVYVQRHPKDVAVSYYHLLRLMRTSGYIGDFDTFWTYFEKSLLPWTPFFHHIEEGLKFKDHPNVLFLTYEEMIKDIPSCIRQVAKFLGKSYSEDNVTALANHLDIKNFRSNPSVNFDILKDIGVQMSGEQTFVRKGKSGSSSEYSQELSKRADEWIENQIKGTQIKLPDIAIKN